VDTNVRRHVTLSPVSGFGRQKESASYTLSPTKTTIQSPSKGSPTSQSSKTSLVANSPVKGAQKETSPKKEQLSPDASGLLTSIMLRKPQSLAYFLDLLTPTKVNTVQLVVEADNDPRTPRSPSKAGMDISPVNTSPKHEEKSVSIEDPKPVLETAKAESQVQSVTGPYQNDATKQTYFQFPKIRSHLLRPAPQELSISIQNKLSKANKLRAQLLQDRKRQLQRYFHSLKLKLLLHDSRLRLDKLRLATQVELQQSVVELNRQMLTRRKREQVMRHTEHVRRVQVLVKMKKMMELRRAVSESFCDYLKKDYEADDEDALWSANVQDPFGSRGFQKGLRVIIPEEEEYDAESVNPDLPRDSPSTAYNSSPQPNRVGQYASDLESFLYGGHSPSLREPMSSTIRRTKSLPHLVLDDNSDGVFLEILSLLPPITRFSLRELDMDEVLANAQLRHDILFDPDLQFKPSSADNDEDDEVLEDGEDWGAGDSKTKAYWSDLQDEVKQGDLFRLPLLVSEIRAIMVELLPSGQEIKGELESKLDSRFVHQQIQSGIMNPVPLFQYIADVMKLNCAPFRDPIVDQMVAESQNGNIVKALKICFDMLELMKLVFQTYVGLCQSSIDEVKAVHHRKCGFI
jgi:hypothetical protein